MKILAKLKQIKGDASFRKFYRNQENNSILVISKKEKSKKLRLYIFKIFNNWFVKKRKQNNKNKSPSPEPKG